MMSRLLKLVLINIFSQLAFPGFRVLYICCCVRSLSGYENPTQCSSSFLLAKSGTANFIFSKLTRLVEHDQLHLLFYSPCRAWPTSSSFLLAKSSGQLHLPFYSPNRAANFSFPVSAHANDHSSTFAVKFT